MKYVNVLLLIAFTFVLFPDNSTWDTTQSSLPTQVATKSGWWYFTQTFWYLMTSFFNPAPGVMPALPNPDGNNN